MAGSRYYVEPAISNPPGFFLTVLCRPTNVGRYHTLCTLYIVVHTYVCTLSRVRGAKRNKHSKNTQKIALQEWKHGENVVCRVAVSIHASLHSAFTVTTHDLCTNIDVVIIHASLTLSIHEKKSLYAAAQASLLMLTVALSKCRVLFFTSHSHSEFLLLI